MQMSLLHAAIQFKLLVLPFVSTYICLDLLHLAWFALENSEQLCPAVCHLFSAIFSHRVNKRDFGGNPAAPCLRYTYKALRAHNGHLRTKCSKCGCNSLFGGHVVDLLLEYISTCPSGSRINGPRGFSILTGCHPGQLLRL